MIPYIGNFKDSCTKKLVISELSEVVDYMINIKKLGWFFFWFFFYTSNENFKKEIRNKFNLGSKTFVHWKL